METDGPTLAKWFAGLAFRPALVENPDGNYVPEEGQHNVVLAGAILNRH